MHLVDHAREYIEENEEMLVRVQGLVAETESETALRVMRQAAELHRRSQGMLGRGMVGESLAVAPPARLTGADTKRKSAR